MSFPFSDPVWHPSGQIIGFNHTPLVGFSLNGTPPCIWYTNSVNADSAGFYLINKDRTGFTRATNFELMDAAWSPDGNVLAFALGANIYTMAFDGVRLDTASIMAHTDEGGNFHPSWSMNGDSIFFDSNRDATEGNAFYAIWKMAADGTGIQRITSSSVTGDEREPIVGTDNRIYFVTYANSQPEIFSMNTDGSDKRQITSGCTSGIRRSPKFLNDELFYWDGNIYSTPVTTFSPRELVGSLENYDVSSGGQIVYSATGRPVTDPNWQTLWILDINTVSPTQLTFNY